MTDNLLRYQEVKDVSEARLWKILDSISNRLGGIETQLSELARLEERISNQDKILTRHIYLLDKYDKRLRKSELLLANQSDRSEIERFIQGFQKEIRLLRHKISTLESNIDVSKGQKDVAKEILKVLITILSTAFVYYLTTRF